MRCKISRARSFRCSAVAAAHAAGKSRRNAAACVSASVQSVVPRSWSSRSCKRSRSAT
jgi:hypothetical protein